MEVTLGAEVETTVETPEPTCTTIGPFPVVPPLQKIPIILPNMPKCCNVNCVGYFFVRWGSSGETMEEDEEDSRDSCATSSAWIGQSDLPIGLFVIFFPSSRCLALHKSDAHDI